MRSKVFYILLLKPVLKNILIDNNIKAEDEEEKFEVEKILDLKEYMDNRSRKQVKYLVKQLNYLYEESIQKLKAYLTYYRAELNRFYY